MDAIKDITNAVEMTVAEEKCTGCAACQNACPTNAIIMSENQEGFLIPRVSTDLCINCGKCTRVCPTVEVERNNYLKPLIYAVRGEDDVRKISSSGGMFTMVAEVILDKGGAICGAGFDDNMKLRHVIVEKKDDLLSLCGSKYLQSEIGTVYSEIKSILLENRLVLFVGCPCQVAGLKNYLATEYSGLYTMDLLCHGVPSQKMFSKYLDEQFEGKVIRDVKFRDKKYGWTANKIKIVTDEEEYERDVKTDVYEMGFHKNVFLRKSCSYCKFSEFPRLGDLSIGDFWGIEKIDPNQNDGKGTSMVFVNNKKGQWLLDKIQAKQIKKIDVDYSRLPNRIYAKYDANKYRNRFFSLVANKTMSDSMNQILNNKFDIGLVGNYRAENFGGALTYYCLYSFLENEGYSTLMVERPRTALIAAGDLKKLYKINPYPEYAIAMDYRDKIHMRELNEKCETFLVGSDQLFQYQLFKELGEYVTLDWVRDNKKKIAYAASFGHSHMWGNRNDLEKMAYFMQKFDSFFVRESSGVQLAQEVFGVNAEQVVDPVFLVDISCYENMAKKVSKQRNKKYVAAYILDPTEFKANVIKYVKDVLNLDSEVFSEMFRAETYTAPLNDLNVCQYKVDERVECLLNSDFVVTDSFHGTCLAIIMGKPFVSLLNAGRGADRFTSLMELTGLGERLIQDKKIPSEELILEQIDYSKVRNKLKPHIEQSRKRLIDALNTTKRKCLSEYDIILDSVLKENDEIRKTLSNQQKQLQRLVNSIGWEYAQVSDIYQYLEALAQKKKDIVILIAVKDTPGFAYNQRIDQGMKKLGLNKSLMNKHWHSYVALIDSGRVRYEILSRNEEKVGLTTTLRRHKIILESQSFRVGNTSKILVDNIEYSVNTRGINIVVMDKKKFILYDSVSFDTHEKLTCFR